MNTSSTMNAYAVIILVALVGEYLLSLTASVLNLKAMTPEVPGEFEDLYDAERYATAQRYASVRTRFGLLQETLRLAGLLAFWQLGGFGWLDALVRAQGWGPVRSGLLFVGLLTVASAVLGLPFRLYSTFVIEERFGFNRTTMATFWADRAKGWLLAVVLGGGLLAAILFFFEWAGPLAWLWCWGAATAFMLVTQFVAPTWIMPLFNTFSPLGDGALRDAILGYARSVEFPLDGIFVIDGSRRSSKANAFFTGFGKHKRIALFDTLIEKQTVDELVAVVAHEVGHYKRRHVLERLVLAMAHTGAMFWLLSFFLERPGLFTAFRVTEPSVYAGLLFFGLLFTPIELVLSLGVHARARKNEFEADEFAVTTTGASGPLIAALKKLSVESLTNLTPHPLTVMLSYSHPPLLRRIQVMRAVDERGWEPGTHMRIPHIAFASLVLATACQPGGVPGSGMTAESLMDHIRVLSSDELEGRAPGSPGETRAVTYLTDQFQQLGLSPGNPDGTFVQKVPLVGITPQPAGGLDVERDGVVVTLEPGTDYVAFTKRVVETIDLEGELVFVGYGVVAPENDWDDFKEVDVTGKVLLMLVNDPPGPGIFGGRAMTYYGRWTYKFESAAARGAAGVFVIHETEPAGYPWEVIGSAPHGEQFDLVTEDRNMGRARVEGWMQRDATVRLFELAGLDFEAARRAATQRDFVPVALGLTARTTIVNTLRTVDSQNVVARLQGSDAPDETVIYVAHWDHLGRDESLSGDQIFNGAKDNASGTAALLEIAAAFAREAPPRRSVLFLAVTAEEQGLLGSRYYAGQPLYPTSQTVAAINMDGLNVLGRTRDVTVIGMGQSRLDDLAARLARDRARVLRPDPEPEKGFYYRSDHFEFAKVGIPAFDPDAGVEFLDREEGWGLEMRERYTAEDYHQVSDEVKDYWDLSGAIDDLELLYEMGRDLATGQAWPEWSESSEFRAIREADRSQE